MRTNALSALGKMSYSAHMCLYPILFGGSYYAISNYVKYSNAKAEAVVIAAYPKLSPVDPDDFQPFSAIPYHNNPELRYRYANIKMFNYIDKNSHLNLETYSYKSFHDSYDHDNKKSYVYDWVSTSPADDIALKKKW